MNQRSQYISKIFVKICGYLIVVLTGIFLFISPSSAGKAPESFSGLVEKFGPTVVNIYSTKVVQSRHLPYNYFFDEKELPDLFRHFFDIPQRNGREALPEQKRTSLGSGVLISDGGYIVTNNHVVENADQINVKLSNYEEYQAKVVGRDKKTDLALIKINPKHKLPFAQFGDSDELKVGDWVLAVGNPFGFEQTVTAGIVSGKGRSLGNGGPYQNFIQTDASINPGNSGGPLFNMEGQMMGINTAIYSRSGGNIGLGFAIPANMAKNVISQLRGTGKVSRGMLGVLIQPVTPDLASQFGMERTIGALVSQVMDDSPAEKAGIKAGDIILMYQGSEISQMNMLPSLVAQTPIGTEADIVLYRDGKRKILAVVIGELPESNEEGVESPTKNLLQKDAIGMSVQEVDDELAESLELTEPEGLLITDVVPDKAAYTAGLRRGDIILEAGIGLSRTKVSTMEDLNDTIRISIEKNKNVLLLVKSGKQIKFAILKLEKLTE